MSAGTLPAVRTERVVENLRDGLLSTLESDVDVVLLGEDLLDPYGGAFKATRGLSTRFPDRVICTPISEGGIVGVGAGIALAGGRAIVELMFGDFITLAFDQLVNFAAKSTRMYGRRVPVPLVVRCPTGGGRGYGPTHSQSPQKHLIGVPGLALYEMTPFHDSGAVLRAMLATGEPCVYFEDKVLYTQRMHRGPDIDELFALSMLGDVARVRIHDPGPIHFALVAGGGMVPRALAAMRRLLLEHDLVGELFVPSRLYPLDLDGVLPLLSGAEQIFVVEESAAGGTWGAEVAHAVHTRLWGSLRGPVRLVHSAGTIIPTATHLEREVLVSELSIYRAVRGETP